MQGITFARIARRCEPMNHHVPSWIGLAVVICILSALAGQIPYAEACPGSSPGSATFIRRTIEE